MKLLVTVLAFLVCSGEMSAVNGANTLSNIAQSQLDVVRAQEQQRADAFNSVKTVLSFFAQRLKDGKIDADSIQKQWTLDDVKISKAFGVLAKRFGATELSQVNASAEVVVGSQVADAAADAKAKAAADALKAAEAQQASMNKQLTRASWMFMVAALTLVLTVVLLQRELGTTPEQLKFLQGKKYGGKVVNAIGLFSAMLWFSGFSLFVDWIFKLPGPLQIGLLLPAATKLIASFFFVMQPLTALVSSDMAGIPFANFAGIMLFHFGNMISAFNLGLYGFDSEHPFAKTNFPFWGTILCLLATTLLSSANYLIYYKPAEKLKEVSVLQLAGTSLLVVGCTFFVV